jgi:hypothetical protein
VAPAAVEQEHPVQAAVQQEQQIKDMQAGTLICRVTLVALGAAVEQVALEQMVLDLQQLAGRAGKVFTQTLLVRLFNEAVAAVVVGLDRLPPLVLLAPEVLEAVVTGHLTQAVRGLLMERH